MLLYNPQNSSTESNPTTLRISSIHPPTRQPHSSRVPSGKQKRTVSDLWGSRCRSRCLGQHLRLW
jgi:hypothetical protein